MVHTLHLANTIKVMIKDNWKPWVVVMWLEF